jgi:hypothetical protein
MNLAAGPTDELLDSGANIRRKVVRGDSACGPRNGLKELIASLVPNDVNPARRNALDAAIDSIRAQVPC